MRVKAGLRTAKAKQRGLPDDNPEHEADAALRAQGVGWKRIAADMGVGVGTIYWAALDGSKIPQEVF